LAQPFLSIIIPVFNAKEKLPVAIGSIVSQTYTDYEIVIIDGSSTDGSVDLIKSYSSANSNIRFISETDKGIYDAMNKGIELSIGKWLFFLGADDTFYEESTLSTIAGYLESTDSKITYGNVEIVGDTSWAKNKEIYDGPFTFEKLLNKNICHQSIFYKSDFIKNEIGKYNINYNLCADWDFNLRCYSKASFLYVDQIVARFYGGGVSTISNQDKEFSRDFLRNVMRYFNLPVFDPHLNDTNFNRFHEVLAMQRKSNFFKYIVNRLRVKLR
jgi:glycosyltransferase involved in cell wall biosynthesis